MSAEDKALMHEEMRSSVRGLCAEFPGAYWRERDAKSEYPTAFVKAMGESGYLSLLIPEEYGGSGLGLTEATIVLEEVHRSGCNAGALHAQMYTMGTIMKHGSEEQKDAILPKVATGEIRLQAFGVSEPNSGTDTLSLETTATLSEDGTEYVINGQKLWTSRAEHSDMMVLLAKTAGGGTPKRNWLSTFIVDMEEAQRVGGMTIRPIDTMINHSTCEVYFDELRIPAKNLVANEGDGLKTILGGMNAERVLIASECIGDARFFVDKAVEYANGRQVFGRPIGKNQGVQFPIAESYAQLEAAALMVHKAASLYDAGLPCGEQANMAKLLAADASWKAADVCMQTHGGYAFAREYDIERKWRETRLYRIAPISSNLILSFLAEKVLGMPRSY